jgi:hypothetical protein
VSKFSAGPDIINKDKNIGLVFNPKDNYDFKKKLRMAFNSKKRITKAKINSLNKKYDWFKISKNFLVHLKS